MASFDTAVDYAINDECGNKDTVTNDPNDPGKTTRWGISQRANPEVDVTRLQRVDAVAIYRAKYWMPIYADIDDQDIVNKLFSLRILMGAHAVHLCLQRALRAACGRLVTWDGILGQKTLLAVNAANPRTLLAAFKSELAGYLRSIPNPAEQNGWSNRAYA